MFTRASVINTYRAGTLLEARRLVKFKVGSTTIPPEVVYTAAGDAAVGVTEYGVNIGEMVAVRPLDVGLLEMTASEALDANEKLYSADNGKVTKTPGGDALGVAYKAAEINEILTVQRS